MRISVGAGVASALATTVLLMFGAPGNDVVLATASTNSTSPAAVRAA